ncbi:MAG: hypothetical protein FWG97_03625, partial [Deltaproteobacteria bacterium]|nr:hypothetical protein [Deltaproteobacteria bacterium]
CNNCGYNFIEGDGRVNPILPAKKALAVILYSLGKASFNFLGRIFSVAPSLTYRWIAKEAERIPEPEVEATIILDITWGERPVEPKWFQKRKLWYTHP